LKIISNYVQNGTGVATGGVVVFGDDDVVDAAEGAGTLVPHSPQNLSSGRSPIPHYKD
jgi:hypothetical protein